VTYTRRSFLPKGGAGHGDCNQYRGTGRRRCLGCSGESERRYVGMDGPARARLLVISGSRSCRMGRRREICQAASIPGGPS
jgi:hypothetical protein